MLRVECVGNEGKHRSEESRVRQDCFGKDRGRTCWVCSATIPFSTISPGVAAAGRGHTLRTHQM